MEIWIIDESGNIQLSDTNIGVMPAFAGSTRESAERGIGRISWRAEYSVPDKGGVYSIVPDYGCHLVERQEIVRLIKKQLPRLPSAVGNSKRRLTNKSRKERKVIQRVRNNIASNVPWVRSARQEEIEYTLCTYANVPGESISRKMAMRQGRSR